MARPRLWLSPCLKCGHLIVVRQKFLNILGAARELFSETAVGGDRSMTENNPFADVCFVTCLESGLLEQMTIRLIDSLRRFGGRASSCRIFCVCPRRGPALLDSTRDRLRAFNADLIECAERSNYTWYQYLNKWLAAKAAERHVSGGSLVFLDSDVLVLGEPIEFCLSPDVDFAALPEIYSSSRSPPDEVTFWKALCKSAGINHADLPPIILNDGTSTPLYWNGGVVAFRHGRGLPEQIITDVMTALDRKIAGNAEHVHFIEQRMVGISAVKRSLRHRPLSISHNTNIDIWEALSDRATLASARILHYHGVMEKKWDSLLEMLRPGHPAVHDWLGKQYSALNENRPLLRRTQAEVYRLLRSLRRRSYVSSCAANSIDKECGDESTNRST